MSSWRVMLDNSNTEFVANGFQLLKSNPRRKSITFWVTAAATAKVYVSQGVNVTSPGAGVVFQPDRGVLLIGLASPVVITGLSAQDSWYTYFAGGAPTLNVVEDFLPDEDAKAVVAGPN